MLTASAALHGATPQHPAQALIDSATAAVRADPEKSRRDAQAALAALQRQPDPDLAIRAHLLLCDYQSERDLAAAGAEAAAATALLPQARDQALRAGILTCQGETRESAGANQEALGLFDQAVAVAGDAGDDEMLAGALYSRGYLLGVQGQYAAGLIDLRRSHDLYDKVQLPIHALSALDGVASLYDRMGDTAQARHLYQDSLRIQRQDHMLREQAVTEHNLGRVFENEQDWADAENAFAATLDISRQLGYPRGEAYAQRGLAAVANGRHDPRQALALLARADALLGRVPDARLAAQVNLARGNALHQLGRLSEALASLNAARAVFQSGNAVVELAQADGEIAAVQAAMGDWRAAYQSAQEHQRSREALLSHQLDERFALLKVEFDTANQQKENATLARANAAAAQALEQARRVRLLQAIIIGLGVALVAVLAWLIVLQRGRTRDMHTLAMTDELTAVPNRRAVLGRLNELLRRPEPPPCGILIMDVDFFKRINDQYGHAAGDAVLRRIAECVSGAVREPAFFGRLGGEEFLVALPHTDLAGARRFAEGLRERVMRLDIAAVCDAAQGVTASLGVTATVSGRDDTSAVLRRADAALYAAKHQGRNCVRTEAPAEPAGGVTQFAQRAGARGSAD